MKVFIPKVFNKSQLSNMNIYEAVKSQKKLLESSKHFYEHVKIMKTLRGLYIDINVRLITYYLVFNYYHFKLFKLS